MYDSTGDTIRHILRVQAWMHEAVENLRDRAEVHDQSKLASPEKEVLDVASPRLWGIPYGTDEYYEQFKESGMQTYLDHHYANNSHHPEFYENGLDGMSLFDILEGCVADWKTASERHEGGDIWKSLEHNRERFNMSDQLYNIIFNTYKEMGW